MVSHLEVIFQEKPLTQKNIDEYLKISQRQLYKEALSVQYKKNKNISLLLDTILIKYLPGVTTVLH